jgi:predicted DsbA family dithiol-disulfide isomerase
VVASPVVVLDHRFPLEGAQPYAVVGAVLAELLATGTNFRVVEPSGMNSSKWP